MTPESPYEYSQEQIRVIQEAQQLEQLLVHPGWVLVEGVMTALQKSALGIALAMPTADAAAAVDALRKWQITDEVVSSIRANVLQTIQHARDLAPQNDRERIYLQEVMYARSASAGDPDSD